MIGGVARVLLQLICFKKHTHTQKKQRMRARYQANEPFIDQTFTRVAASRGGGRRRKFDEEVQCLKRKKTILEDHYYSSTYFCQRQQNTLVKKNLQSRVHGFSLALGRVPVARSKRLNQQLLSTVR